MKKIIKKTIDELYEIYENKDHKKFIKKLQNYFTILDLTIIKKLEDEALEISCLLSTILNEMLEGDKHDR